TLLPRRGARRIPALRRAHSPLNLSEKNPARQGRTRLRQFVCPGQPVLKKGCRPKRANTLTQFASPAQPVLKKGCRPKRVNRLRQFASPAQPVLKKEKGIPFGTP
ncbi:hypothetical protein, partial [Agathobaculum butyriciproducens]|uniref:hypothetical protein n=1 Tax=Agathobaculum butyriciproducens TaxID=1628085 RepID=UPI001D0633BE|nr:hypothetical protein [Agathobaculum butyriciproducens]